MVGHNHSFGVDRRDVLFLAVLLAAAFPILCWNLNAPFVHHWESQGPKQGMLARNFLRFGKIPLDVSGPTPANYEDPAAHAYGNRPPLGYLAVALSYRLFAESEAAFRGPLAILTACAAAAFLVLMRTLADRPTAWLATALWTLAPLVSYYSTTNIQLPMTALLGFLAFLSYRRWRASGGRWALASACLFQVLACATDWPGYYVALVPALHLMADRRWKAAAGFLALNVACFGAFLAFVHAAGFSAAPGKALEMRLSGPSMVEQVLAEGREMAVHMTVAVCVAALLGTAVLVRSRADERCRFLLYLPALGCDQLLFRGHLVEHDFLTYPLMAFFAAAAATGAAAAARVPVPRLVRVGIQGLAALAFVLQTGVVLHHRLTHVAANGLRHQMGLAVAEATAPSDRVLLISPPPLWNVAYYADRYVECYEPGGALYRSYMGPKGGPVPVDRLAEEIDAGRLRVDWVVVNTRRALELGLPGYDAASHDAFWYATGLGPEVRAALRGRPEVERRGFVFIRTKP